MEEWLAYAFSFIKNENYEVTTKGPSENSFCFSDDMYYGDRVRQSMQQRMNCHIICSS